MSAVKIESTFVMFVAVKNRRVEFEEARPAINRAALRWIERDCRLLAAPRAIDHHLDPLLDAGFLSIRDRGKTLVFCLLAVFAPLRRIFKMLIAEKGLFASTPHEIFRTIDAQNVLVSEFRRR